MKVPIIIVDSCADMDTSYYNDHNIERIKLSYICEGKTAPDNGSKEETDEFYNVLRQGIKCSTSQVNAQTYYELFEKLIREDRPIIYLAFSAALSASYSSSYSALEMIKEKYPDCDITILDSKAASLGEGLLLDYLIKMRDQGKSKEEILDWFNKNYLKVNHLFSVEELSYLHRGGRLSATSAFIGDMLNIQPFLHVDVEGRLVPLKKERGRKKILKSFIEGMEERIENPEEQTVFIGHGDCLPDALRLKEMIMEKIPVKDIMIGRVGPVIGAHTGPTVLAVFFLGKTREG